MAGHNKSVRVLAIDPGSRISGFGIIDIVSNDCRLVASGLIALGTDESLSRRLCTLRNDLTEVIKRYAPHEAAVESIFFAKNAQSALVLGHARGVVLTVIEDAGLPLFEYSPALIKQNISGSGRATKNSIAEMVKILLKLPRKFEWKGSDQSDALAIALAHAQIRRWNKHDRTSSRSPSSEGTQPFDH